MRVCECCVCRGVVGACVWVCGCVGVWVCGCELMGACVCACVSEVMSVRVGECEVMGCVHSPTPLPRLPCLFSRGEKQPVLSPSVCCR